MAEERWMMLDAFEVRCVAPANVADLSGLRVLDSVTLEPGDPVLLPVQNTSSENGVWFVSAGPWTRASTVAQVKVTSGATYSKTGWVLAPDDASEDGDG